MGMIIMGDDGYDCLDEVTELRSHYVAKSSSTASSSSSITSSLPSSLSSPLSSLLSSPSYSY